MEQSRKSIYFDLDNSKLKEFYPSDSEYGYKNAWSKIRGFMEEHGFEHTQYSGYESVDKMSYDKVFAVIRELNRTFPWFRPCAQVCRVNEVGDRYDALEYIDSLVQQFGHEPPSEKVSLSREAHAMRAAAKALDEHGGHSELSRDKTAR